MSLAALVAIVAGTLVSEDLTAIGVGVSVRDGSLPAVPSLIACFVGIYLGDVGLWAAGRFGGRWVLGRRSLSRVPTATLQRLGAWIDEHPRAAIVGSRFLPGTRLPLYVAAGIWSRRPCRVLAWMFVAVALWTPFIVLGANLVTNSVHLLVGGNGAPHWMLQVAGGVVCLGLLGVSRVALSQDSRARLAIFFVKLRRWEFWPSWAIYAPVAVWIAWLAVRYRSVTTFTAANPGIEDGGFVGESKSAILARLPQAWVMPWAVIEPGTLVDRLDALQAMLVERAWAFPLVAKPDVGQRGTGVRWIGSTADAVGYLRDIPGRIVIQVPHHGPFEAGVFYVRMPGDARGRIFSITDKRFPVLVGDGVSTVDTLIHTHPRFRLQAAVFLARHAADRDRVLMMGERLVVSRIGNHSQGTEFLDGRHLLTPALEARIDAIAHAFDGFYFGRFDVRYRDRDAFMAGTDLAILELNGVTSEATHIYGGSIWNAWHTLMQQWTLAFAIGHANRNRGYHTTSTRRIATIVREFLFA